MRRGRALKSTRQARLGADTPESRRAESEANWRTLPKPFLSASALGSWSFCHTKPFVERVLDAVGIQAETPEMRAGTAAHEEIQNALAEVGEASELTMAEAIRRKAFVYGHEYPLKDERRMLRGIADLVFTTKGFSYVLELKNAVPPRRTDPVWRAPLWFEHGLQLQFYALLAESDFGQPPHLALSYLKGIPKGSVLEQVAESRDPERALLDLYATSAQFDPTPETRGALNREIQGFRAAEKEFVVPLPNHANPRRCSNCRVRNWCPRRLDQPGTYEPVSAELLDRSS